jgi:X-X-X-Leu-X-X-Gly heptad repeat protein
VKKALFITMFLMLTVSSLSARSLCRNETVYVNLDPSGTPLKTEVVTWLRTDGKSPSSDAATLMDIKNIKSAAVPVQKGDYYSFYTNDTDIFYSGTPNKALPVSARIVYFMNGQQADPLKLKGLKGKLEIRMTILNNTSIDWALRYREIGSGVIKKSPAKVAVPFMVMVSTDLPIEKYGNIDAPQGAYAVVGDQVKMNWLVFPFPKETISLKADVTDFKIPSIMFTVIPKMPPLPKVDVEGRMNKIYNGVSQVGDFLKKAHAGAVEMNNGHKKLKNALTQMEDGTSKLIQASEAQAEMTKGTLTINQGLSENLAKLKKVPFMSGKADQAIGYLDIQAKFLELLVSGGPFPEDVLSFLRKHGKPEPPVKEFPGIKVTEDGIRRLNDGIKQMSDGAALLENGSGRLQDGLLKIRTEGTDKIKKGIQDGADPLMKQLATIDIGYIMAQKYDRFSGRQSDIKSSVEFIMKTPGE